MSIEAMKQALEALEESGLRWTNIVEAITSLRQAIEEAEKPCKYCHGTGDVHDQTGEWRGVCVCEAGKAEKHEVSQEPVACQHKRYSIDVHEQIGTCIDCGSEGRMRFVVDDTHPQPKREWVGLTGQQKNLIARISVDVFDAMHRTGTKLKELNT